jgi:ankyrin repeat protein
MGINFAVQATNTEDSIKVCSFIRTDITVDELKEESKKYPDYSFAQGAQNSNTAVIQAVVKKNLALVEYMIAEEGKELLSICNNMGETPLHIAIINKDSLTAKKLIELGSPINIIKEDLHSAWTPLECALSLGEIEIASILLRRGAILRKCTQKSLIKAISNKTLEAAKKVLMTTNEVIFAMHFIRQKLPFDVVGNIICKSVSLDQ